MISENSCGGVAAALPAAMLAANSMANSTAKRVRAEDDLQREVYGVLGVPLDVTDMTAVVQKINSAAATRSRLWISTVNLNYLIASQSDMEFRESLLESDLCTADGMPIVWMARLLGVPIKHRVAGSDLFDALRRLRSDLKIFLFGGAEGVAETACRKINADSNGLVCAGFLYPGFGPVEAMSTAGVIDDINASEAHILAVALGADKGQKWLLRNQHRLRAPVRAHLGASIGFQAGSVRRAPVALRQIGLEWAWRILQEPKLWRRYARDGLALFRVLATGILPLLTLRGWQELRLWSERTRFRIERDESDSSTTLGLLGRANAACVEEAVAAFRAAAKDGKPVVINCAGLLTIDARFVGLLVMLDKWLKGRDCVLSFSNVPPYIRRFFRLSGFGYLLESRVEKA